MPENRLIHNLNTEIVQGLVEHWIERMKKITENTQAASDRQTHYYNKSQRECTFVQGERFWRTQNVLPCAEKEINVKLWKKFSDNFWIAEALSPTVYNCLLLMPRVRSLQKYMGMKKRSMAAGGHFTGLLGVRSFRPFLRGSGTQPFDPSPGSEMGVPGSATKSSVH